MKLNNEFFYLFKLFSKKILSVILFISKVKFYVLIGFYFRASEITNFVGHYHQKFMVVPIFKNSC